jgi:hypothetical protein
MAVKKDAMLPQLKALKTTDVSPLIRMAGVMLPRVLNGFLASLDKKQKSAFDQVMPVGGEKKIYLQLMGTPTPPIVIGMAQPPKMSTMSENEVRQQQISGIRLTVDDLQLLAEGQTLGNMLRLVWRLKGQTFTLLGMLGMFWPFLRLGPAELKDMGNKMTSRFKPLFDLMPRPKK